MLDPRFQEAFQQAEVHKGEGAFAKALSAYQSALNFITPDAAPNAYAISMLRAGVVAYHAGKPDVAAQLSQMENAGSLR